MHFTMFAWLMRRLGARLILLEAARMNGLRLAIEDQLHHRVCQAVVELFPAELVWHAIGVPIDPNMVISTRANLAPFSEFVGLSWKWLKGRKLMLQPPAMPTADPLLKRLVVEFVKQLANLAIRLFKGVEGTFAQRKQNPSLRQIHCTFGSCLIFGLF
ncbi:hypothetical protein AXH09_18145 [Pseudomonas aeruginosa]|nr:hypothetical protein AXH09_18145 [Pseudomonas aeruginosa]